jgi:hypothetical protein
MFNSQQDQDSPFTVGRSLTGNARALTGNAWALVGNA